MKRERRAAPVKGVVCCVIGTRPEAIKMAPVILKLRESALLEPYVLATGQHTSMMRQPLDFFGIEPNKDLALMKENQSLDYLTSRVLEEVGEVLEEIKPFFVLVHGDTTTTMAASLAAFYRRFRIGHVEAGLRSGNVNLPFPEELNRIISDRVAGWWFAPTEGARENLLREGCDPSRVIRTGNTVIDALLLAADKVTSPSVDALSSIPPSAPVMLLTAHRRESWGEPLEGICSAVARLMEENPDLWAIVPMHRNPEVRRVFREMLSEEKRVILCEPLDYPDFIWSMKRSDFILTDSGGIQEETTVLGVPTLVMRELTERPEAVEFGTSLLVGTDPERILEAARKALDGNREDFLHGPAKRELPFGSGKASEKIVESIEELFLQETRHGIPGGQPDTIDLEG
ncbi:MAG: UDP-N-acetylglucosamine 2-epimerase (non-hydrolyzing) [Thermovirgaceae bacterium]